MWHKFLIVGTILSIGKVGTVPIMSAATRSLFWTMSRLLDCLVYIETITDAYSQYFVNDNEYTENSKERQK